MRGCDTVNPCVPGSSPGRGAKFHLVQVVKFLPNYKEPDN